MLCNGQAHCKRYNNTSPPAETSPDTDYDRRYWYDTAGNPIKHKRGTDPNMPATYNALNLCTSINDPDPPYDPVETFSYDDCDADLADLSARLFRCGETGVCEGGLDRAAGVDRSGFAALLTVAGRGLARADSAVRFTARRTAVGHPP